VDREGDKMKGYWTHFPIDYSDDPCEACVKVYLAKDVDVMLEALTEAETYFENWCEDEPTAQKAIELVRKAIAKAEGSTVSPR
jgi:hypothetical protein